MDTTRERWESGAGCGGEHPAQGDGHAGEEARDPTTPGSSAHSGEQRQHRPTPKPRPNKNRNQRPTGRPRDAPRRMKSRFTLNTPSVKHNCTAGEESGTAVVDLADHQRHRHQISAETEKTGDADHGHQRAQPGQPPDRRETGSNPQRFPAPSRLQTLMGRLRAAEQVPGDHEHRHLNQQQQRQADAIELPELPGYRRRRAVRSRRLAAAAAGSDGDVRDRREPVPPRAAGP